MPVQLGAQFKSRAQQARVISEAWGEENLYCARCDANRLKRAPPNTRAVDFACLTCEAPFQLKSSSSPLGARIVDAAYAAMTEAIRSGQTPNLLALHYDRAEWRVQDLTLIPSFAFSLSAIEPRKPLAASARRAGWVGCSILLGNIPMDARINVVSDGAVKDPALVRREYARLKPLQDLGQDARGWTLDVLTLVRSLGVQTFTLQELYSRADHVARLHPENRHVKDKIRQQLQRLRDMGLLRFEGRGHYGLVSGR